MIYITGDFHADKKRFSAFNKLKKKDTLIITGDFGFIWDGSKKESEILKWIGKRRYSVLFIDGFYDNLELLKKYPIQQFNGGLVREISGNLKMLLRGEVYEIENKKIFAFGGGTSLECDIIKEADKEKLPSNEEMVNGIENLKKVGNSVDVIITHEAPLRVRDFINFNNYESDILHKYLDTIRESTTFKEWYFGKYHNDKRIPPCYNMMFLNVAKI
ncbi:MAG: hypothetical protein RSE93_00595 [Oscillospiraceae bacterium]